MTSSSDWTASLLLIAVLLAKNVDNLLAAERTKHNQSRDFLKWIFKDETKLENLHEPP